MGMIGPLVYEVVACSVIAWGLLSWANKYVNPSVVSINTVVQPAAASVLSVFLVWTKGFTWAEQYGITLPGWHHALGALFIALGLSVMHFTEARRNEAGKEKSCSA